MAKSLKKQFIDGLKRGLGQATTEAEDKSDHDEIRRGLQRFKMDMMREMPFYGDILMRVEIREDTRIETARTNGKRITYNPDFFAHLKESQRNYIILHEVLHILLLHWKRSADRIPVIWNIACDYVVNGIIDKWLVSHVHSDRHRVMLERPPRGCFEEWYMGEAAEQYYQRLYEENKDKDLIGDIVLITNRGKSVMIPKDLKDAEELDQNEVLEAETFIKELVSETLKRRGTGGCYIPEQLIKLTGSRKLPWNKLLFDFLEEREEDESSYLTPERKYLHMDLIVPGLSKTEDKLGNIWAFVDTSGSIAGDDLNQFMTQLYRISKEFECTFNIAFWDTQVSDVFMNVRDKDKVLECRPRHSGGTDINCIYDYIREQKHKPDVMLILTDGYFGPVADRNAADVRKFRKKTILVLSEDGTSDKSIGEIGQLAQL